MGKVQEYLREKKIIELGLPKLYIVKSTKNGVENIIEHQVVEIIENVSYLGNERTPSDRYKLEDSFPYEVDILRGETSKKCDGYGTGFGDLWEWSYFCSLSLDETQKYLEEETERIKNKY